MGVRIAAGALLLAVAACSSSSSQGGSGSTASGSVSGKQVVIGGIIAETGVAPYEGTNEAVSAYFDQLNASGGINGYKIKYIGYDSAGSAQTNAALMTRLIGQGAVAVIDEDPQGAPGGFQVAQSSGTPVLGGYAYPQLYSTPTLFPVTSYAPGVQTAAYYAVLKSLGVSKIALLTINVPVGVDAADYYAKKAGAAGLTVVSNEVYAPTQTDFTGYVSKEMSAGAQVVIQIGGYVQGVAIAKAMQQQGSSAKLVIASGLNSSIATQVGSWGNGKVFTASPLLVLPERKDVASALAKYGFSSVDPASQFVALGWSDAQIAAQAVKLLGSKAPSAKAMLTALDSVSNFSGTYLGSPLTYGSGDHKDPSQCAQVLVMQNGAFAPYGGKSSICWTGSVAP